MEKLLVRQQSNWPDYVFDGSYHFVPLDSVAAYIEANGHLSGIPSAGMAMGGGIDLDANQAALLKKIEELTLYTIQQEKRIRVLETRGKQTVPRARKSKKKR